MFCNELICLTKKISFFRGSSLVLAEGDILQAISNIPSGSEDEHLVDSEDEYIPTVNPAHAISSSSDTNESSDTDSVEIPLQTPAAVKKKKSSELSRVWRWRKRDFDFKEPEENCLKPKGPITDSQTPLQAFLHLMDKKVIDDIVFETNKFRLQSDRTRIKPVTELEIRRFMGIALYMSIIHLPRKRMYWSPATIQVVVANIMTCNRFDEICSLLHFNDNEIAKERAHPDYDRLHKIRPLLEQLNENYSSCAEPEKYQAIDEQMIPFKGHHSLKTYMAKKPTKWGYKVWVRAGQTGYAYQFQFQGDKMAVNPPDVAPEIGESGKVVLRLSQNVPNGTYLFFDNYFASPELLVQLKNRGLGATCTMRRNRTKGCPLKTEKEMKKEGRGSVDFKKCSENEILIAEWYDNKLVIVGSNVHSVEPMSNVQRYDRKLKVHIQVPRPNLIAQYNKNMGGVDKMDMLIALYRNKVKSQKWYKRIFYHLLDMSVVNAWLLYREFKSSTMLLADFKIEVSKGLIASDIVQEEVASTSVSRDSSEFVKASHVSKDARYDKVAHFPLIISGLPRRCQMETCHRRSRCQCRKCGVFLCLDNKSNCFYEFHHA